MRAGPAVGRGRPLVEDEDGGVLAALEALLEDAVLLPELEDAGVERREVDARRDVLEPGLIVAEGCPFGAPLDRLPAATMEGCVFAAPLDSLPAGTIHEARFLLLLAGLPILAETAPLTSVGAASSARSTRRGGPGRLRLSRCADAVRPAAARPTPV